MLLLQFQRNKQVEQALVLMILHDTVQIIRMVVNVCDAADQNEGSEEGGIKSLTAENASF